MVFFISFYVHAWTQAMLLPRSICQLTQYPLKPVSEGAAGTESMDSCAEVNLSAP